MSFNGLFLVERPIIGMVHLLPLPDSPHFQGNIDAIYERALSDANNLLKAGIDGLIIENFGDEPYLIGEPTAPQLALISAITHDIRGASTVPVGVNVQFNGWQAEIAIAYVCKAQFTRVEVFVDRVISAQGLVEPCSAQIMRYKHALGANTIQLWADVQTKYTTNVIPQPIAQSAKDAQNAGADAIIVTGVATGSTTPIEDVKAVSEVVQIPVIVGSGTNIRNVKEVLREANGAIVGSALKLDGKATNPVSLQQAKEFMVTARSKD